MKRKIISSVIFGLITVLLFSTLFFANKIEIWLKLKPDLSTIQQNSFQVHFIDVGQGDAIAIRFPNNKTMLVDSGPVNSELNLKEYLDKIFFYDNYDTFDYVFLTHSDIDNIENMEFIIDNYKINNFYRPFIYSNNLESNKVGYKVDNLCYDGILNKIKINGISTFFSTDGGKIDTGSGLIEMFLPKSLDEIEETNDFSPFLIISSNGSKVCLSGDSGIEFEEEMINRGVLEKVDLLKLAHHGSKYSNSEALLNVLSPEFVACSVGDNDYGHPSSDVLLRLANFDAVNNTNIFSTFKSTLNNGNLIYYVNNNYSDMEVATIKKLDTFIFIDWYMIVIVVEVFVLTKYLIVVIPKKIIKINKHMKNMKH